MVADCEQNPDPGQEGPIGSTFVGEMRLLCGAGGRDVQLGCHWVQLRVGARHQS